VEAVVSRSKPPDPGPPPQPPLPWYEGAAPSDFIAWVYRELDAQGIDILDLPARFKVLDELMSWRDSFPNEAYSNLVNWNHYDAETLIQRSRAVKCFAKPRIAVSAEITSKHNLSVRWHPAA